MAIQNCKGCGKMIGETPSGYCEACKTTNPDFSDLHKVKDFLYDNPGSSIATVSEATGVSVMDIAKFIRDGAIQEISGVSTIHGGKCSCGAALEGSERICKTCKRENDRAAERAKKDLAKKVAEAPAPAPEKGGFYTKQK